MNNSRKKARELVKNVWNKIYAERYPDVHLWFTRQSVGFSLFLYRKVILIEDERVVKILSSVPFEFAEDIVTHSLGHELTHMNDKDFWTTGFPVTKRLKMLAKINEVHADYGGALLGKITHNNFIKIVTYKMNVSENSNKIYCTHPSWVQRRKYASYGKYDNDLVRIICDDYRYGNPEEFHNLYERIDIE